MLIAEEGVLNEDNFEEAANLIVRAYSTNDPIILNSLIDPQLYELKVRLALRKYQQIEREVNQELGTKT